MPSCRSQRARHEKASLLPWLVVLISWRVGTSERLTSGNRFRQTRPSLEEVEVWISQHGTNGHENISWQARRSLKEVERRISQLGKDDQGLGYVHNLADATDYGWEEQLANPPRMKRGGMLAKDHITVSTAEGSEQVMVSDDDDIHIPEASPTTTSHGDQITSISRTTVVSPPALSDNINRSSMEHGILAEDVEDIVSGDDSVHPWHFVSDRHAFSDDHGFRDDDYDRRDEEEEVEGEEEEGNELEEELAHHPEIRHDESSRHHDDERSHSESQHPEMRHRTHSHHHHHHHHHHHRKHRHHNGRHHRHHRRHRHRRHHHHILVTSSTSTSTSTSAATTMPAVVIIAPLIAGTSPPPKPPPVTTASPQPKIKVVFKPPPISTAPQSSTTPVPSTTASTSSSTTSTAEVIVVHPQHFHHPRHFFHEHDHEHDHEHGHEHGHDHQPFDHSHHSERSVQDLNDFVSSGGEGDGRWHGSSRGDVHQRDGRGGEVDKLDARRGRDNHDVDERHGDDSGNKRHGRRAARSH